MEVCIVSLVGPGIQAIPNRSQAVEVARRANDRLAEDIAKNPKRLKSFAASALQDAQAAAPLQGNPNRYFDRNRLAVHLCRMEDPLPQSLNDGIPETGRRVVIKGTPLFYLEIAGEQRNIIRAIAKLLIARRLPDATVFSGCDLVHVPGDGDRRIHTADVHSKN